jgi:NAD(P)H dehydrogenase (quinone)
MFGFTSKNKKVFIFLGQEDKDQTTCGIFADEYEKGAKQSGHEVRRANIGDLKFDPLLHKGYKTIQELEPDLKMIQDNIRWADHFVLIYPTWWSAMPAILKGFFDRVWLPGFAFHFHKNGMGWDKLLKGKSARVIVTMDSWPLMERFLFGDSTNEITRAILGFSGMYPVRLSQIGSLKKVSDAKKEELKEFVYDLGLKAK